MKILCKNDNYIASGNKGVFPNAFIKDTIKTIYEDKLFEVTFKLFYVIDGEEKETNYSSKLRFTTLHNSAFIINEDGEEKEITDFFLNNGVYLKENVSKFGMPSADKVKGFFEIESIWSELIIKENHVLTEFIKDWLLENIVIDSKKILDNFKF